jgi:hypothetical protein
MKISLGPFFRRPGLNRPDFSCYSPGQWSLFRDFSRETTRKRDKSRVSGTLQKARYNH